MIPLNPYRWFVPDPMQFYKDWTESVSLSLSPQLKFSEKQLNKTLNKVMGKNGEYVDQLMSTLFKQQYPFDPEKLRGLLMTRYGGQVRVNGKGAKFVKSAMNGTSEESFELTGFRCSARCVTPDVIHHKLRELVYPNIQLFTSISQQKPKDLPDKCEACGACLSYNAAAKKVQPVTEIIDVEMDFDEDIKRQSEESDDNYVHVIWQGRCSRCSSEVLDWDTSTLYKWFKKMAEYQMQSKKRVFVNE